ncbi:galectin-8-like, partial [Poecilia reticulata]|uniref:galectin-8-like n=1 Tax=Poecilia reticulata TaxID=8081 RepID=UPI0004A3E25F
SQKVPFRGRLEKGLKVGRSIIIKGQTSPNANSFSVNLRDASGHDIILHLNPRLAKRVFVRNSFLSECWGAEELDLEAFPFAAGEYFEMIVRSDARHFRVAVNGSHQFDYKHRVQDLSAVGQLEVVGDVTLMDVRML